ncbi:MAG: M43 family zinc metalloprotease [Cytophagales bacterium]
MKKLALRFSFFCTLFFFEALCQDFDSRCGHDIYLSSQTDVVEKLNHTNRIIDKAVRMAKIEQQENKSITYTIPVVVHVLHKGEPYGQGWNIRDEQIFSQIDVLNEDFNRINADTLNSPEEYNAVAGRINIRFCLAKIDPNCEFTNGITRQTAVKRNNFGQNVGFGLEDDALIKSFNIWPTDQYLNIWVCDLIGFVGYATFPFIPQLNISNAEDNNLDGIVIQTTAFGRNQGGLIFNLKQTYNRGRTATHEIGHWLGLFHTWGNTSCSNQIGCVCGDDFCDDTPATEGPLTTCVFRNSFCTGTAVRVMRENYMDYTPDACMNLFTKDQVSRMKTVLEVNERRKKILNSGLCNENLPASFELPFSDHLNNGQLSESMWSNANAHVLKTNPFTNNLSLDFSDTNSLVSNMFKHTTNEPLYLDLEVFTNQSPILNIFLSEKGCSDNWRRVSILDWRSNLFVGARMFRISSHHFRVLIPIPKLNGFRKIMIQNVSTNQTVNIEKIKLDFVNQGVKVSYDEFQQPYITYESTHPSIADINVYDVYGQQINNNKRLITEKGVLTTTDLGIYSRGVFVVTMQTDENYYTFKLLKP